MIVNVISIVLLLVIVLATKNSNEQYFMNKESTDSLRGLCMIAIVLNHYSQVVLDQSIGGKIFIYSGSVAVGFFFFISGYANYLSYNKAGKDQGSKWVISKVINLCFTILVVALIYFLYQRHFISVNIGEFIYETFTMTGKWYIKVLMVAYVILYLNLRYIKKYNVLFLWIIAGAYSIVMYKLNYPNFWYNSVFCFPLGVMIGKYRDNVCKLINKINSRIFVILAIAIFMLLYCKAIKDYNTYGIIVSIVFSIVTTLILYYYRIKSKVLIIIGKYSLEIYLCHGTLLKILYQEQRLNNNWTIFVLFIIITMIISYITKLITKSILKAAKC